MFNQEPVHVRDIDNAKSLSGAPALRRSPTILKTDGRDNAIAYFRALEDGTFKEAVRAPPGLPSALASQQMQARRAQLPSPGRSTRRCAAGHARWIQGGEVRQRLAGIARQPISAGYLVHDVAVTRGKSNIVSGVISA